MVSVGPKMLLQRLALVPKKMLTIFKRTTNPAGMECLCQKEKSNPSPQLQELSGPQNCPTSKINCTLKHQKGAIKGK